MAGLVLDVSNNATIDEATFRRSGAVALIAKATEGSRFQDVDYGSHRRVAAAAGVPFGAYLFLRPSDTGDQAAAFLHYAQPAAHDLPAIVDCEVTDGLPMASVAARCLGCLQALEQATKRRPILYSSLSFLLELLAEQPTLKRYPVWEAQYPGRLGPRLGRLRQRVGHGVTVVLWQYTDREPVAGRRYDASMLLVPLKRLTQQT